MLRQNEKLLRIVVILLCEVIYAHLFIDHLISYQLCMTWLNWSLKLHSRLWTIPHLILTHNTRDFVQIMSISFVWLYMFKCDVYAQNTCWSNPKRFFSILYVFESDFVLFLFLVFVQHAFLCYSSKTGSEAVSQEARDLELPTKCAWGKSKVIFFIQKLLLLPCGHFVTNLF